VSKLALAVVEVDLTPVYFELSNDENIDFSLDSFTAFCYLAYRRFASSALSFSCYSMNIYLLVSFISSIFRKTSNSAAILPSPGFTTSVISAFLKPSF
jgi:hypothetical protein